MLIPDLSSNRRPKHAASLIRDLLLLGVVVLLWVSLSPAHPADIENRRLKIAFELSSNGSFESFLTNVEGVQRNFGPLADITVVACSLGVELFRADGSAREGRLARLADQGVDFIACGESLAEAGVDSGDLVGFVRVVNSGYRQLQRLQEQGWARVGDGETYVSHF